MLYVTTSWDDSDALDTKIAELLSRYGAKGTFYITKQYREHRLTDGQIRALAGKHEIGAHTLTHPDLTAIPQERAFEEIAGSKKWLEEVTGKEVPLFCYPSGRYNAHVAALAQKAGYKGARTTASYAVELPDSAYEMPATLHMYPFPFRKKLTGGYYWRVLLEPLRQRYSSYRELGVPVWKMRSWLPAAKAAFEYSYKNGEVFHLWGHSWELEQYGMWGEFEELLKYIAAHKDIAFVTNSELLEAAKLPAVEVEIPYELIGEEASWATATSLTKESVVYSFGAGEDMSWDLGLLKKYGLTVNAFDPTPKSIEWVQKQKLPPQFVFHPYGIAGTDGTRHFAEPLKPHWVSYSMARDGIGVEAPVKKLSTIMKELGHSHIDVLKLDIEGGEYEVLNDILASNIPIRQILVEFHHRWKGIGMQKTRETLKKLNGAGYKIFYISPGGDEFSLIKI